MDPAVEGGNTATTQDDNPPLYDECQQHKWPTAAANAAQHVVENKGPNVSVEASSSTASASKPAVAGAATAAADAKASYVEHLPINSIPYEEMREAVMNRNTHIITYEKLVSMGCRNCKEVKTAGNIVIKWFQWSMETPVGVPIEWVVDLSDAPLVEFIPPSGCQEKDVKSLPDNVRVHVEAYAVFDRSSPIRTWAWPTLVAHFVQRGGDNHGSRRHSKKK